MAGIGKPKQEFCQKGHEMSKTRQISPSGHSQCKTCKKESFSKFRIRNKAYVYEYNKKYREKHKQRLADHKRFKKYGITGEEFKELCIFQENKCKICGRLQLGKLLHVDHNHITGKVRGLLCGNCNTSLGLMGEDVDLLKKAIDYLIFSNT